MKSKMKRGVALLAGIMLVLCCRWEVWMHAEAAGYTVSGLKNIGMINSDFLGNGEDHSALIYWYMNGTGKISYCLQYGYLLSSGQGFNSVGKALANMSEEQIRQLMYCLHYGYRADGYGTCPHSGGMTCKEEWIPYAATQAMVWLIAAGKYDEPGAVDDWGRIVADSTGYPDRVWAEYQTLYANMEAALRMKVPGFAGADATNAPVHTMEWDSSKGAYTVTLTDTTGTIGMYDWALPSSVSVDIKGNQITFWATQELSGELVKLSAKSGSAANREMSSLVFLQPSDAGKQHQVQYASVTYDPLGAWFYLKTGERYGNCRFVKTDDFGMPLAGCRFELLDSAGKEVDTWVTDETGIHELKGVMKEGEMYILRELDVPLGYEKAGDFSFTVSGGSDWQEIVTANARIGATVCINKCSNDGNETDGTEFCLLTTQKIDGAESVTDQGKTYYVLQTGKVSEGKVCFDGLDATGAYEYLLIETKSSDEKQLLPEPIRLGTLPTEAKTSVSTEYTGRSQTKDGITYLYDLTYEVMNSGTMVLPLTGEADDSLVLVSTGCVVMVLMAVIAAEKRNRGII